MSASDEKQKLLDLIGHFFRDGYHERDPTGELALTLEKMLTARPAFEEPESDLDSSKDFRYDCAAKIQQQIRNLPFPEFRLQAIHLSTILVVPKECLEKGGFLTHDQPAKSLYKNLTSVASLVRHYRLKIKEDLYIDTTSIERNFAQENACLHRDGHKCLFTATADPHVARILPISWNDSEPNVHETEQVTGAFKAFFNDDICGKLAQLLANPPDLGSSEKHWNMVSFDPQLRKYWFSAYCGLKCLGVRPKATKDLDAQDSSKVSKETEWEVVIQFHWLNRRWAKPNVEMSIMTGDDSMKHMADTQIKHEQDRRPPPIPRKGDGYIGAVRADNGVPLISGQIFTITMSEQDALNCKMVLDLQWYLISIAAMSGAVSYPHLFPSADDNDKLGQ